VFEVVDICARFPRAVPAPQRTQESITLAVVHHDAGPAGVATEEQLFRLLDGYHAFHKAEGWGGIGYHVCIPQFGDRIYKLNHYTSITVHAKGGNRTGVGLMLQGNFMDYPPSNFQVEALTWLLKTIHPNLPNLSRVLPHRRVPGSRTDCPGTHLTDAMVAQIAAAAGI